MKACDLSIFGETDARPAAFDDPASDGHEQRLDRFPVDGRLGRLRKDSVECSFVPAVLVVI